MMRHGGPPTALAMAGMAEPTPSNKLMIAYGWSSENLVRLGGDTSFSFGDLPSKQKASSCFRGGQSLPRAVCAFTSGSGITGRLAGIFAGFGRPLLTGIPVSDGVSARWHGSTCCSQGGKWEGGVSAGGVDCWSSCVGSRSVSAMQSSLRCPKFLMQSSAHWSACKDVPSCGSAWWVIASAPGTLGWLQERAWFWFVLSLALSACSSEVESAMGTPRWFTFIGLLLAGVDRAVWAASTMLSGAGLAGLSACDGSSCAGDFFGDFLCIVENSYFLESIPMLFLGLSFLCFLQGGILGLAVLGAMALYCTGWNEYVGFSLCRRIKPQARTGCLTSLIGIQR